MKSVEASDCLWMRGAAEAWRPAWQHAEARRPHTSSYDCLPGGHAEARQPCTGRWQSDRRRRRLGLEGVWRHVGRARVGARSGARRRQQWSIGERLDHIFTKRIPSRGAWDLGTHSNPHPTCSCHRTNPPRPAEYLEPILPI